MAEDVATNDIQSIDELLKFVSPRFDRAGLELVRRAYRVAEAAHIIQKRSSGEAYITHPLAVAGILASLKLDASTIAAAILHDVVEDTGITLDDLREQFGDEIANLVDAVTKLSQREGIKQDFTGPADDETAPSGNRAIEAAAVTYHTDREAESLRKMLLGIVKDVRVVLIKLADRLHNMRTLGALSPERQRKIARETLEIYAPLASRLGIWEWKQQLEDLGFRYAEPDTYAYISNLLAAGAEEREAQINHYIERLRTELKEFNIANVEISGRAKQIYSIARKMQNKKRSFDQLNDLRAIRVIIMEEPVESAQALVPEHRGQTLQENPETQDGGDTQLNHDVVDTLIRLIEDEETPADRLHKLAERDKMRSDPGVQTCYSVLGIVHRLWKPVPGEFDDYISVPKDNHYQSLHTAVIADDGQPLEVQIRTLSMHKAAEFGIAAHWLYKESAPLNEDYQQKLDTLRDAIQSLSTAAEDATSFVDALKQDHFKDTVFCFTPKGKLLELPNGSTILDFAYHIHTDLGNHCRGGRVNGVFQPLTFRLRNGDQVEIIAKSNATPSRDWLHDPNYVATANAKNKIRQWFRKQDREQNIAAGKEMIEREMKRLSVTSWMSIEDVYKLFKVDKEKASDFLEKVGYGTISIDSISGRIMEEERRRDKEREQSSLANIVPNFLRQQMPEKEKQVGWHVPGVNGLLVTQAPCCTPLPSDPVIGYITRGQGIRVHHRECRNIINAEPERLIEVVYGGGARDTYPVQFLVTAIDRQGLLHDLSGVLAEMGVNILDVKIIHTDPKVAEVTVWLKSEVSSTGNVATTLNKLQHVRNVFEVKRVLNARQK
ncbi:MAG: bifunctional (p)ppGpp synthetase/guanosine-3',5'-bis(diphosphate) 3'-pyrophosphohydrolase [Chloroflexi bacterium]|nr:bifunctional (p)ppGpp synthetase/guanosine-3',5'-bis(diphosphate) 3'-pyrophosphohydrolase [Chloroflexota bacterium]MCL5274058.1 bifunctional (p)ppGpp synthetase/guanosine-3',5'-bis(diphosphate) 3'-pyrophosphohydrolase [Chloroflexota bacterium]